MANDALERLRVADGETNVPAFDAAAEKRLCRRIRQANDAPFDDERRLVEGIDERALTRTGTGHARLCSGLLGVSHVRVWESPLAGPARGRPFEPKGREGAKGDQKTN